MEQNKLPKNIRQIGEKEDWIRVYIEDYVHTYIQRLRGLEEGGIAGGVLLGKKQRINGVMHLFIRGAAVVDDPFWRDPGQTPGQMRAESSVYFPELEICGFFVSSRQNRNSEIDLVRIFETHFSSEYQVLFNVRDQEEEVFSFSGHGLVKLAGYYIYYEKNEEMQSYIIRQESLRAMGRKTGEEIYEEPPIREVENPENSSKKPVKAEKSGKRVFGGGQPEPFPGRKRNFKTNTGNTGQAVSAKGKDMDAGKKTGKKKLRKGDAIVRLVSIAGIFILAFLLFSDQIKFSKMDDAAESGAGLLSSILKESEAVPAGADSDYINSVLESESNGTDNENSTDSSREGSKNKDTSDASGESSTEGSRRTTGTASSSNESAESGQENNKKESGQAAGGQVSETEKSRESESAKTDNNETSSSRSSETGSQTAGASGSYVFPLRYLVKKGDSLYAISQKYYGNTEMVDAICLENNITDPSSLKYGTVLILPAK